MYVGRWYQLLYHLNIYWYVSYVNDILRYISIPVVMFNEETAISCQLLLAIECLHHLYHTSHLFILYILFQDAQTDPSYGMWCSRCFLLCVLAAKLSSVTKVCRCPWFMTAYDSLWRWTLLFYLFCSKISLCLSQNTVFIAVIVYPVQSKNPSPWGPVLLINGSGLPN